MDVAAARDENDAEDEVPGSPSASQRQEPRAVIECWSTAGGHLDSPKSLPYGTQIARLDPELLIKGVELSVCCDHCAIMVLEARFPPKHDQSHF